MIESKKLSFNVSARTAKLIGMENFANAEGAVVELVKNSYDADASQCFIVFDINDNPKDSSIYIIDNGCGMTEEVITNQWMTIGTDNKLKNYQSKKGRVQSGAKGIGRFALNRLGKNAEMITTSKQRNLLGFCHWEIDWTEFDREGNTLSDIKATLSNLNKGAFEAKIKSFGISKIEELKNLLIYESFFGTIFRITNLNDLWNDNTLYSLKSNLENLIPFHLNSEYSLYLYSLNDIESLGKINGLEYEDFDYRVIGEYDGKGRDISITMYRNELNVSLLETKYQEVFNYPEMQKFPFRLEDFKSKKVVYSIKINDNISIDSLQKVGAFKFDLFFLKNTNQKKDEYPYNNFNSEERKNWLKKFQGIKIYRDDFRVRPYGENGNDWLKLGERASQSPQSAGQYDRGSGYKIRPYQASGTVFISRLNNKSFQDKSSREGIVENDEFKLFQTLLMYIISEFEKDRTVVMNNLKRLADSKKPNNSIRTATKNKVIKKIQQEQEELQKIRGKQESTLFPNETRFKDANTIVQELEEYKQDAKTLAEGVDTLEQEIGNRDEELRLLRGLASSGIIMTSFAHEFRSLSNRLLPRTALLVDTLKKVIPEESIKGVSKFDDPFYHIELMRKEDTKLNQWLKYALNTVKRSKRERVRINFLSYFLTFEQLWSVSLKEKAIQLELIGESTENINFNGFEMDMDNIFNNLISNSIYSLLRSNSPQKNIRISWKAENGYIVIDFEDNGLGLSEEYRTRPERIFDPFETSRIDKNGDKIGTGMGLYIAQGVTDNYQDSSISIMKCETGFKLRVLFKIEDNETK